MDERCFFINQFKQRFRVAGIEFDKAGIARFVWQTSGMARNTDDCFFGLAQLFVKDSTWTGAGADDNNL